MQLIVLHLLTLHLHLLLSLVLIEMGFSRPVFFLLPCFAFLALIVINIYVYCVEN